MAKIKKNYKYYEEMDFGKYGFGPTPTEPKPDKFCRLGKIIGLKETQNRVVLEFLLNNNKVFLNIEFPKIGGARIYLENGGFFKPEELTSLNKTEKGYLTSDNSLICINKDTDNWSIAFSDGEDGLFILNNDSLIFGFVEESCEKVKLTSVINQNETFCGCGERFGGIEQTGERHQFWNCDCGYHGDSEFLELWRSYKNVPLLHSSNNYSLFFNSFYPANSDIGYSDENVWSWDFWGPTLDIYLWSGNLKKVIKQYTDLTGKPFLPPKWAFEYMSGGGNGFWYGEDWGNGNIPEKYLSVLKNVLNGYKDMGTPNVAALYGEGWLAYNEDSYALMKPYGTRMLSWNPPDYSIEYERELLPGVPDSELPRIKAVFDPSQEAGNYIDFFNPNVKQMLINRYKRFYEMGLHGGMLDFAEMVPDYALYCNGMTGREMHNFNPYWYGKLYGEAAKEILGDDYLYYCRGGCAGSQKWCANFSGDQAAKFFGLKQQLSSGLTLGLCGFSAWGADLAGYENVPETDVFIRGIQFSTFQPLMRAHGTRTRCPWDFGEKAVEVYKYYYWLRENMVDMLYSNAIKSHKSGLPMMQTVGLAFPDEKEYAYLDTEYLFCDDFLVRPIMEKDADKTDVFFPDGIWYDLYDGKSYEAGEREIDVCIEKIPVFIKSGAIIPMRGKNAELSVPFDCENASSFLTVTPPSKETVTEFYFSNDEKPVTFVSSPVDRNSYLLTAKDCEVTKLLIYGGVSEILVDGVPSEFEKRDIKAGICSVSFATVKWNNIKITR